MGTSLGPYGIAYGRVYGYQFELRGKHLPGAFTATLYSSQFESNYFTEMCSGSEAGSYLKIIEFVYC